MSKGRSLFVIGGSVLAPVLAYAVAWLTISHRIGNGRTLAASLFLILGGGAICAVYMARHSENLVLRTAMSLLGAAEVIGTVVFFLVTAIGVK